MGLWQCHPAVTPVAVAFHDSHQVFVQYGRFDSHLRQVEFHQTTAFDERQEVGYHASGQVYPVSARQNPETVQCKRAPPERQFFHMQLTEKDDGRRGHAAPVDMAERGIGKPSDFALVAHTAVERMV